MEACVLLLLTILSVLLGPSVSVRPPISQFPRQAPFCVQDDTEEDLRNFKDIFEYHNTNPERFVPVSPDKYHSPTGLIQNITLNRIFISSTKYKGMKIDHTYREFHNYFHISIIANKLSDGIEGLYVQAIAAPLGIPIGEFVADFDCGDCGAHKTSGMEDDIAIVPCEFRPAASFIQPTIYSIGGKSNKPKKFTEAHFHFRYIDYPCFDVTYAQFLVIAVRQFKSPLQYEVFYSPIYKVRIEGVGAPWPMYYGLEPSEILCHHANYSYMDNWYGQRNQKAKVKYNADFDKCTYTQKVGLSDADDPLGTDFCPPGPVHCGADQEKVPESYPEWIQLREEYSQYIDSYCIDCGEWEDRVGTTTWPKPPIVTHTDEIDHQEIYITLKPLVIINTGSVVCGTEDTEERDKFGKAVDGTRDPDKHGCPPSFSQDFASKGYLWGQNYIIGLHDFLMLFTWTVGCNCLIFCARFLKEASFAEKGSGCFGIGKWLWEHIFWTYVCFLTMCTGVFLMIFLDQEAMCKFYDKKEDTLGCFEGAVGHKIMGSVACVIFVMGFLSGWIRPSTRSLRDMVIYYHAACGYISKYLGLISIVYTRLNLSVASIVFFVLIEVTFIAFFIAATVVQKMMDNKMQFRVRNRRFLPVPEGIDTFSEPPMKNARALLMPFMIVTQLALFSIGAFNILDSAESRV